MEVYFRPLRLDAENITREVIALLKSQNMPTEVSVYVELRVSIDFKYELVISEVSIYEGYSYRCIAPAAECVTFDSPFGICNSSARREVLRFANDIAHNYGGEIAIECNRSGGVISAAGGALCALRGRNLTISSAFEFVEIEPIVEAAGLCNLTVELARITKKELDHFDELFIGDHYGVTSISRCGSRLYVKSMSEKIAERMALPW